MSDTTMPAYEAVRRYAENHPHRPQEVSTDFLGAVLGYGPDPGEVELYWTRLSNDYGGDEDWAKEDGLIYPEAAPFVLMSWLVHGSLVSTTSLRVEFDLPEGESASTWALWFRDQIEKEERKNGRWPSKETT